MTANNGILIYCFKCREMTNSSDVEQVTMKNGREAVRSTCFVCGCRKFRIGPLTALRNDL